MGRHKIIAIMIILLSPLNCFAKNYKGAEYRTKEAYLYGRFEVSYQPAHRDGVVSSFFTYHIPTDSTDWNEIDIEFVGRYENIVQFNSITPGQTFHIRSNHIDFNPYVGLHTYAFEWTPDYVAWFIDGDEVYRQTGEFVSTLRFPMKLMMNIWNPIYTNWVGYWNDNLLPAFSKYDWISYYSYSPDNGNYGSNNNFVHEWTDSLNSWDQERWDLATHTFGGNQSDFIPGNVVFNEGFMYLCLTNNVDTGYVDIIKPEVKWARENFDGKITVKFTEEVDKQSAEIASNYLIAGVNVISAKLSDDFTSVTLTCENYDTSKTYSLIVLNVTDDGPFYNSIDLKGTTIIKNKQKSFPVKINIGGMAVLDYLPDQEWSENVEYGYLAGDVHIWDNIIDVENTEEDDIYKSEREGLTSYKVRVPNGNYKVSLLFAEHDNNNVGERVFDIVIENQLLINNLDIFSVSGVNNATQLEYEVSIEDEVIDIYFPEEVDSAFVNAIIVDQLTTGIEDENTDSSILENFQLNQNYPNPFNPSTKLSYIVKDRSKITLQVFDVLGNLVGEPVNEIKSPGYYEIEFKSENLSSGIYFYRMLANSKTITTKKMAILK